MAEKHHWLKKKHQVLLTLGVFKRSKAFQTTFEAYSKVVLQANGELIQEIAPASRDGHFYVGAAVIEPDLLSALLPGKTAEFMPSLLAPAIRAGRAGAYLSQGLWYDIGSPKLLWKTHLGLLQLLEHNSFESRISQLWESRFRKKIEVLCTGETKNAGLWRSSTLPQTSPPEGAKGPSFWGSHAKISKAQKNKNFLFGPNAILYHEAQEGINHLQTGIGLSKHWVSCQD